MRARLSLGIVLLATATIFASAQEPAKPVTNADVVRMLQAGFSDELVLGVIRANAAEFDTSVDALLAVKKAGASDKVISAMLASEQNKKRASAQETPPTNTPGSNVAPTDEGIGAVPQQIQAMLSQMGMSGFSATTPAPLHSTQMPRVALIIDNQKRELAVASAQVAQTKMNTGSGASALGRLANEALSFGGMAGFPTSFMGMGGMFGRRSHGPAITQVWAIPGRNSQTVVPAVAPKFEVTFAGLTGIDPDGYGPVLIRLVQTKDNWRLVGASQMHMGMMTQIPSGSIAEEKVAVRLQTRSAGDVQLEPEKPLQPGEYAIVLHPLSRKQSGSLGGGASSQLFYSVWDFSVPEATAPPGNKK